MRRLPALLALGAAALGAAGCAPKRIGMEVVWPDPPDLARIRFVTAFRSTGELDLTVGGEFLRQVLGGGRDVALTQPRGVALSPDGKRLYIADQGVRALLVADFEKKALTQFSGDNEVDQPFGVAVDAAGNVYVTDQRARSVIVYDAAGKLLRRFGQADELVRPSGIAIDRGRGFVYVSDPAHVRADHHRVLKYQLDGTSLGQVGKSRGSEDGEFNFPMFLDVNPKGDLLVADMMNFRIQVFGPDGAFLRKFGQAGTEPGMFSRIKGLAHDGFGNLYVVDGDHSTVQIFNPDYEALMYFGGPLPLLEHLNLPMGIAIDPANNRIYVVNTGAPRINVYELFNTTAGDAKAPPK